MTSPEETRGQVWERRRQVRFRADCDVTCCWDGGALQARVCDISAGGMRLALSASENVGKRVQISGFPSQRGETLNCKVAWRRFRGGRSEVGLAFEKPPGFLRLNYDRRRSVRVPARIPLRIHHSGTGAIYPGVSRELSVEGLVMETTADLTAGLRVCLEIQLQPETRPFNVRGLIHRPHGVPGRYSVRFLDLDTEKSEALAASVRQRQREVDSCEHSRAKRALRSA